jgi:organic hydroperoxide reductase OsmC/OhrA
VATRAKRLEYGVSMDRDWTLWSDLGGDPIPKQDAWEAEHLLFAGLVRCVLTSLGYHARRAGVEVRSSGAARGVVTKRDEDGRYAVVEVGVSLDVELGTPFVREDLLALLAKAERDCFVGASLTAAPRYGWTVNGEEIR